ncbi:ferredoxin [Actinokineospora sp. NBRC 105648]|nr:ferredoxin [Actinokineospora sp. NBRC 105648]
MADGVVALDLVGPDLPAWSPGAHVDVVLRPDVVRQYSLCGDPGDLSRYRIAVLDEPAGRGGSRLVHELSEGDNLTIAPPRNNFELVDAPRHLFIAGGIGITPLIPMLATSTDWRLVYGGRTRSAMAFAEDLVARHGDRVALCPQDEVGLIDLATELGALQPNTAVYCCGPESLLAAVEQLCPSGSLHVERFSPKPTTGALLPFEVELASTGQVFTIPADRTILEVFEQQGVPVSSSCEEGTCGTCETAVLDGTPDHRDSVLSPEEQAEGKCLMICVSRSHTPRLVLDV